MHAIRGLKRALNDKGEFKYKTPESVVDFLIVGAGVVGLSIAQRLCRRFPTKSVYLLERHAHAGEETSSRNSEVIHSGLYYPPSSLKTQLCLRGRELLYDYCSANNIPYRKTGKLVVAKAHQKSYIEKLHEKTLKLRWPEYSSPSHTSPLPSELLSGEEVRKLEPDISKEIVAALWSPETGIVDSHSFMGSLEKDISESENGEMVYSTQVVRIDPYRRSNTAVGVPDVEAAEDGWVVQAVTEGSEGYAMLARTLINASGLSSILICNSILPENSRLPMYYAKGSYASYNGPGISNVTHLIYPCPETGADAHAFQSLGTHLTLDLQGKIRFGPDIEWINPPVSDDHYSAQEQADFWASQLAPDESRLAQMHDAVMGYLPGVILDRMQPDYVGIRPKLLPPDGGFQDFLVHIDYPTSGPHAGDKRSPMISLLGIESPGLTASLAIAELIVQSVLEKS